MQCYNHPTHMATAICSICGNGICPQCQGTQAGQVTCPNCQAGLKPAAGPLVPSYIDGPGGTDEFATMMLPRARGSLIAGGIGGIMLTLAAVLHMIPMRSGAMLIMVMIFALMGLCLMGSGFFGFRTVFNSSLAGATGGLLYAAASISVLVLLAALSKSRSFFFLTTILLYIIQLICYIVMTVTLFKHKNEGVGGGLYLPAGILKLIATVGLVLAFIIGIVIASSGSYAGFRSSGLKVFQIVIGLADLGGNVLLTVIMFLLYGAAGRQMQRY